jgi:hypothetical protein
VSALLDITEGILDDITERRSRRRRGRSSSGRGRLSFWYVQLDFAMSTMWTNFS